MSKFTLKIKKSNGFYISDDKHAYGGIDLRQRDAFHHLIPNGFIDVIFIDRLMFLATIHDWDVEILNE